MYKNLFRGKPKDKNIYKVFSQHFKYSCNNNFVFGSLLVDNDGKSYICVNVSCIDKTSCVNNGMVSMIEVEPETVGRYTGAKDNKGRLIYENDIIEEGCNGLRSIVVWDEEEFTYKLKGLGIGYEIKNAHIEWENIGNIFDNPDLIEGEF